MSETQFSHPPSDKFLCIFLSETLFLYILSIDIWAIDGDMLKIFELKRPKNNPLGIISELMFYTNVVNDLLSHNILISEEKAKKL